MRSGIVTSPLFRQQCYIGGQWLDGDEWIEVDNPWTCEIIGRVPRLGGEHTALAIDAAARALPAWRQLSAAQRAVPIRRWGELLQEHRDLLGALMTLEQGKPLAEACGEIDYAASFL